MPNLAQLQKPNKFNVCFFLGGWGLFGGLVNSLVLGQTSSESSRSTRFNMGQVDGMTFLGDFAVTGTKSDAAAKRVRHLTAGREVLGVKKLTGKGDSRSKYLPGCQCGAIYIYIWLYLHTYLCYIIIMLYIHIYKTYIFIDYTLCTAQVN